MNASLRFDQLRRSIVGLRLTPMRSLAIALLCAAGGIGARFALDPFVTGRLPFITFFPALLVATLWGGRLGGMACLTMLAVGGWYFIVPPRFSFGMHRGDMGGLIILLLTGVLLVGASIVLREAILALIKSRDRERLLAQELRHRVKNNLALMQSIARQTARSSPDVDTFLKALTDRLGALSAATDLLTEEAEEGVPLTSLVEQILTPFAEADGTRLAVEGGAVTIRPEQATAIAMCLHELATNATKYGALSNASGQVRISWSVKADHRVRIAWHEAGGPPVRADGPRGFGTALLSHRASGEGRLEMAPDGVRWSAEFRVA
jgi:two-component sensor histidine kinase